ncbi:MAG: DNA helicase RecQ [Bacteroidales bacterium]
MYPTSLFLHRELKRIFGFDSFRGAQEEIITSLMRGEDLFVIMPTGGGKSLCYQLPALLLEGTAVIVSPLIALMKNQVDALRGFLIEEEGIAHFLNSSLNRGQLREVKRDLLSGVTKVLYVAPESLTKEENIELLKQIKISFFAVDEAHCISEWGHDFRPEYRRINHLVSEIGSANIIALTATATPKVQEDIQKNLGLEGAKLFKDSFNRPNLYYEVRGKKSIDKEIVRYIKNNSGKSGIIYCLSRKKVEEIATFLNVNGIKALHYHAGLDASTRAKHQDQFLMEEVDVIVATIAFGMGIDKPDVRFVIHYDMPKSLEGYYQETGRAGRDGGEGVCIAFYSYKDIQKLDKFLQNKSPAEQEVGRQLLQETTAYSESPLCRRVILLNYFGEQPTSTYCGSCDNCLAPKPKIEASQEVLALLNMVDHFKEHFKIDHLVNVLAGESNSLIKSYNHHNSDFFGIGITKGRDFWRALIRQLIALNYLKKEVDSFGLIFLTPKGREFISNPRPFSYVEEKKLENDNSEDSDELIDQVRYSAAGDEKLLGMLKSLRSSLAKKMKLPPFVIFNDTSLEEMSIHYPISFEELQYCQGVGGGKARKYGEPFIDLIARYVEENDIDRPSDIVVKSTADKSSIKIFIITSIDRKLPLDEIAQAKGLDLEEVISEVESIVHSGTKLNIDYFIRQMVDDDKVEDIYEYFLNDALTDSLQDAANELGRGYTDEEIRLVRIKFLSEIAN